ncbi:hypothetical protein HH624_004535 [Escherichia coli]|nr:hypothetical protein [Escherichia coli]EFI9127594.1 hypothetical protein [Escherichia coli]
MTAKPVPVSRRLATDQPQIFHKPAIKPAAYLMASLVCNCGDASYSG